MGAGAAGGGEVGILLESHDLKKVAAKKCAAWPAGQLAEPSGDRDQSVLPQCFGHRRIGTDFSAEGDSDAHHRLNCDRVTIQCSFFKHASRNLATQLHGRYWTLIELWTSQHPPCKVWSE